MTLVYNNKETNKTGERQQKQRTKNC